MSSVYTVIDNSLSSVANAIREKGETSSQMSFPIGFINAIKSINTGSVIEIDPSLAYVSDHILYVNPVEQGGE